VAATDRGATAATIFPFDPSAVPTRGTPVRQKLREIYAVNPQRTIPFLSILDQKNEDPRSEGWGIGDGKAENTLRVIEI